MNFCTVVFSKGLSQKNSKSFLCPWGLKFFLVEEFYVENHPSVKIHTYEFSPDEYYSCRQVHRFLIHRSRVKNRHVTTVVHRRRPRKGESDFHCQFLGVWVRSDFCHCQILTVKIVGGQERIYRVLTSICFMAKIFALV